MAIPLKSASDIQKLRDANKIIGITLDLLKSKIKPGISLLEIDAIAEECIRSHGALPGFKGLYGFPSTVCTSLNEVVIHGIPTDYVLKEGDVIGCDIGTILDGWCGDGAFTMGVGKITKEDQKLIDCSYDTLMYAISILKSGMRFKELSFEIEKYIRDYGYVPLEDFCGHGIGKKPHEEPSIPNYLSHGNTNGGPKIKNGMVFCLEPMICQKEGKPKILENKWDVVSIDGLRTSHYEHTVAMVNGKAEILSLA